jgi:hypothetical protein
MNLHRHVIIEGPDGSGKTTLARKLCAVFDMNYHHEGPPPPDMSVLHHYAGLLATATRPTVFDRLHLGELVYGPLLRGASRLKPMDEVLMTRLVRGTGTDVIICQMPWETTINICKQKQELIKDEAVMQTAYLRWARVSANNSQRLDLSTGVMPKIGQHLRLPDNVIGSPYAKLLLVGEQSNSDWLDLPFFGTKDSSGFLNERLVWTMVSEDRLAFTNALDHAGRPRDLYHIVTRMPMLTVVVALGNVAAEQLELQTMPEFIKVIKLPHPQYWKRFKSSTPQAYTKLIREAYNAAVA